MNRANPLHISVQPTPGRQLPADFYQRPLRRNSMGAIQIDNRNLEELWRAPQWGSKPVDSPIKNAQLKRPMNDRSDSQSGPQWRMDGALKLIHEDGQWQVWQDELTGARVHKRRAK
jgi:nitrogen fixation protein FixH